MVARRPADRFREPARRQGRGVRHERRRQRPRNLTQNPAKKDVRPAWSPDGRRIAFVSSRDRHQRMQPGLRTPPERSDIYVMNADGSRKRNLTRGSCERRLPTWSPDGRRIAFLRGRGLRGQLYVVNADGSGLRNLTPKHQRPGYTYRRQTGLVTGRADDLLRALPRQHRRERSAEAPAHTVGPPSGRPTGGRSPSWATGRPGYRAGARFKDDSEIYVMNADGSGTRRLTHNLGYDAEPAWSPDGRKITFQSKRRAVRGVVGGSKGGDLRHERRREREAEPDPEPCAGR